MGSSPTPVEITVAGRIGRITLNRPSAINALTLGMIQQIQSVLDDWRGNPRVEVVVLSGNGNRGFCAGGDIRAVRDAAQTDPRSVRRLWREEYALDASLATYPKPVVSLAHGITMGGGVGLASHVRHRVVVDDLVLAMPEVMIGLVPDVAGLWLLARAPGELGTHAALTGARLSAPDARSMGFADCTVIPASVEPLVAALQDDDPMSVLGKWDIGAKDSTLLRQREWIDECYSSDEVAVIHERLASHTQPAARRAANAILLASPTAATVGLAAIRRARELPDMLTCLEQDYRVSSHFLLHPDLLEGIRAQVVDKDRQPKWQPPSMDRVDLDTIAEFFNACGPDLDLTLVPT